ncbi:MAG TPA: phenylalanine--tRNA ligase subunit beta [Gemmatimonadaceae bacterium]|nr:phenylalanine--tRNA ligase subunit beta [Gemmatimonadaceae bacterium]
MNASYAWLRAFVDFDHTPAALRDLITARTATVDELVPLRADLADIVVARVLESQTIPETHLTANKVDAGGPEPLDVVCGAPNVAVGKLYPFARSGTTMPALGSKPGLLLGKRKIRGFLSNGMLCSQRELGLGADEDGIWELDVDAAPGTPILDVLPVGDTRLVIDVLPNRPDLLSHVGLAREIAAATGLALRLPTMPQPAADSERESASGTAARPDVAVEVSDVEGAPRYAGRMMRGVRVGPSPAWLVERIEAVGGRSINNVVDATNYVMHELGQPLHAFDAAKLAGGRVVVRRARPGEHITTLDGATRILDEEMTVIADAERAQAIAGVIGGQDSEIGEATRDLFLESARFDPRRTRATRRRLNVSTDASYRFERGVDVELPPIALDRLTQVIAAVAGGTPGAVTDVYSARRAPRSLDLRVSRVARLLGDPVPAEEIAGLLASIGFGVAAGDSPGVLRVAIPSWRSDVDREVDLVEEVARLRGYDRLSDELRPYRASSVPEAPLAVTSRRVRASLVAMGLLETRAMPFVSADDELAFVRVRNPLAENEAFLRTEVLQSLARRAEHNLAHMQGNVRLFEIGAVFAPGGEGELPNEEYRVAALVMGQRRPPHFTEGEPPAYDQWDAKAIAEAVAEQAFPGSNVSLAPVPDQSSGALWRIDVDGDDRGVVRRVALDAPVWAAPAFGVELRLASVESGAVAPAGENVHRAATLSSSRPALRPYHPLPTTPAAERDVTLLVPNAVAAADVERVLHRAGGEILESVALVTEFRGAGVPDDARALTWRLTFRHPERTLSTKEVEGRREKLLRTLDSELGVKQRA